MKVGVAACGVDVVQATLKRVASYVAKVSCGGKASGAIGSRTCGHASGIVCVQGVRAGTVLGREVTVVLAEIAAHVGPRWARMGAMKSSVCRAAGGRARVVIAAGQSVPRVRHSASGPGQLVLAGAHTLALVPVLLVEIRTVGADLVTII